MDNVIHVNFAKRHAQAKAKTRMSRFERIVGVNSDGMIVFSMGIVAGIFTCLGLVALFSNRIS